MIHVELALETELTYLEVAAVDVPRSVTRFAIARELDGARAGALQMRVTFSHAFRAKPGFRVANRALAHHHW